MSEGLDAATSRQPLYLLLIAATAVLSQLPLLSVGFLSDDFCLLMKWGLQGTSGYFSSVYGEIFYRPLGWLAWSGIYQLSGTDAAGYRLLAMSLHGVCSMLVFVIARAVLDSSGVALWSAVIFSVHPIHVEALGWLSCIFDLGSTLFLLLALWAILFYARAMKLRHLLISLACALFALYTKENALVLPAMIALVLTHQAKLRGGSVFSRMNCAVVGGFSAVAVVFFVHRLVILGPAKGYAGNLESLFSLGLDPAIPGRLLSTSLTVTGKAVIRILFPFNAPLFKELFPAFYPVLVLMAGLPALLFFLNLRQRFAAPLWLLILLFIASLVPIFALLNPVVFPEDLQNSRYLYLPSVFSSMILGTILLPRKPGAGWLSAAYCLMLFAASLANQTAYRWASQVVTGVVQNKDLHSGDTLYLNAPPDNIHGAYAFRNCTENALAVFQPEVHYGGKAKCRDEGKQPVCEIPGSGTAGPIRILSYRPQDRYWIDLPGAAIRSSPAENVSPK